MLTKKYFIFLNEALFVPGLWKEPIMIFCPYVICKSTITLFYGEHHLIGWSLTLQNIVSASGKLWVYLSCVSVRLEPSPRTHHLHVLLEAFQGEPWISWERHCCSRGSHWPCDAFRRQLLKISRLVSGLHTQSSTSLCSPACISEDTWKETDQFHLLDIYRWFWFWKEISLIQEQNSFCSKKQEVCDLERI